MPKQLFQFSIRTPDGQFIARYSAKGLADLKFPSVGRASPRAVKKDIIPTRILRWHRAVEAGLKNSLAGRQPKNLPPLDLTGTEFQKRVWNVMRKISAGKTKGYGEVAKAIGKPKAVRAVGGACGANPVPIFVPCHRVLAANKKLGGFSSGLDWKRKLLAREGVKFQPQSGD